jgi:hypothetical protein
VTLARSYREAPDTDGEIELRRARAWAGRPAGRRTLTVRVTDAVGVDLVARRSPTAGGPGAPEASRARVGAVDLAAGLLSVPNL